MFRQWMAGLRRWLMGMERPAARRGDSPALEMRLQVAHSVPRRCAMESVSALLLAHQFQKVAQQ
jgi:hypothetical protein